MKYTIERLQVIDNTKSMLEGNIFMTTFKLNKAVPGIPGEEQQFIEVTIKVPSSEITLSDIQSIQNNLLNITLELV